MAAALRTGLADKPDQSPNRSRMSSNRAVGFPRLSGLDCMPEINWGGIRKISTAVAQSSLRCGEDQMIVTLPERFEFLSDAWLDEARKFLERECNNNKERLGGRAFFVGESCSDEPAPPKFDGRGP